MRELTEAEAKELGEQVGIDFDQIDLEEFQLGMSVELEHGSNDAETDITGDDPIKTAKIAWVHLKEISDYYTRLKNMEMEASLEEE